MSRRIIKTTTPLNAVTATTTSVAISMEGVRKASLLLTRADHSSGSSAFKVQVSIDGGTTYVDFNSLIQDLTNTNAQDVVRATTITLSSNTSVLASVDLQRVAITHMKVVVTETTDGTHTAVLSREYEA